MMRQPLARSPHGAAAADFTGHGLPPGHGEDPFHGGGVGRMVLGGGDEGVGCEPASHRPASQRRRGRRQRRGVGGIEGGGQSGEQVGVVAQQAGLAGQHGGHVPVGDGVEQGQHVVANAVAPERGPVVGGIDDRDEPEPVAQGACFAAPERQQGPPGARPHAGQAVESRSPQEVEEDRLGLIVGGVPGQDIGGQDPVTGRPRPCLEVRPGGDVHSLGPEAGADAPGGAGHHIGLGRRPGPQPMVDVDGGDAAAGLDGEDEEGQRIGAARYRAGHGGPGRRKGAAGQQRLSLAGVEAWAGGDQGPGQATAALRPIARQPPFRRTDLVERRQVGGAFPAPVDRRGGRRRSRRRR